MLLTDNASRWYSKPRGYAGDFLSIHQVYENRPSGRGELGTALDEGFLELAASRAVRNRRSLLSNDIISMLRTKPGEVRVTSLACGPAREVFDAFASTTDREHERLHVTLVDLDREALDFVDQHSARQAWRSQLDLRKKNLLRLVVSDKNFPLAQQDLIYSIGLIDYFDDRFVVKLLDWIHSKLDPGGRVVLGNFHPHNPCRALMDHVLDWRLIHRDESNMNRLFRASAFGCPCDSIRFEAEGVNLFASAVKL